MGKKFDGQVIWITGGGSGLGRALALEFARQGASLALSGRREERLEKVVGEIEKIGPKGLAVPCDVTEEDQVKAAVEKVVDHFGALHVSVANAGFGVTGKVEDLTAEDWRRQFDVNVVGLAVTARQSLPELKKTKGRLVLMGSVVGCIATPGAAPYTASKYAVRAIGQTLAMELANSGVSVTTIQPGFVESEIGQVDNKGVYREERDDERPKKFMWKADRAARVMAKAIYKRKREYTFTGHGRLAVFLGKHFPGLVHFLITKFMGKKIEKMRE